MNIELSDDRPEELNPYICPACGIRQYVDSYEELDDCCELFKPNKSPQAITKQVLNDEEHILLEIPTNLLWVIISAVQLAYRHPGIGTGLKQLMREATDQMAEAIIEKYPESAEMIEFSWHEENDI